MFVTNVSDTLCVVTHEQFKEFKSKHKLKFVSVSHSDIRIDYSGSYMFVGEATKIQLSLFEDAKKILETLGYITNEFDIDILSSGKDMPVALTTFGIKDRIYVIIAPVIHD